MRNPIDCLNDLLYDFRDTNQVTSIVFTLVATSGFLLALFCLIKLSCHTVQALRLYFFSQFCCLGQNTLQYGRWVVVTGATDGIGQAMAREFARRGHSIMVVGRNDEKLKNTKALLKLEPNVGQVETIKMDLADSSADNYKRLEVELDADRRDIGIMVNNAGVATDKYMKYADYDMDSIRSTVNVNAMAVALFSRVVLPGMLSRRRGLIVNVSSLMGEMQQGYFSVYNATKCFVNSFSQTLQIDYSSDPVHIINLTPGVVHTKMLSYLNIPKPTLLMPSADYYARSAINAAKTRISSYSGCWTHGVSAVFIRWTQYFGILHLIFLLFAKWKHQLTSSKEKNYA